MTQPFFITGFLRSGTTLLEKLLHNHPQMVVASQPFPYFFLRAKCEFFRSLNLAIPRYPLGDLFLEDRYTRNDFLGFLKDFWFSEAACREEMLKMQGYSGQMTPDLLEMAARQGHLADVFRDYATDFPALLGKPSATFSGSKEVFCEEFIPYFLSQKIPTLLIIRDPRAVVNSIHSGRGSTYANSSLTVLQILRAWRKSVAFAMRFQESPLFHLIRHEALVENPQDALRDILRGWGLPPLPLSIADEIRAQDGTVWQGNSSFSSPKSTTPRFLDMLDKQTLQFIETVCAPEMRWLGKDFHATSSDTAPERTIVEFRDGFQKDAPALTDTDVKAETERLQKSFGENPATVEKWLIFAENAPIYASLSEHLPSGRNTLE